MKVRLERTPTGWGERLSLWRSCLASAEQLIFVEGQMLEYLFSYELPAGFWLWEKGENGGKEHTEPHCLNGWALVWGRGDLFSGKSVFYGAEMQI